MIHRKLVVLASLLVGFVNIALAGVGDLDTLNVRSQAPVKERMPDRKSVGRERVSSVV